MSTDVGFIMFDPEMDFEEIGTNLRFLRSAGLWNHDSRLTKELRLEAGTPLVASYREKGLITGPLDVDELCYPYRWRDPRAEEVHARFRRWEVEEQERVYALQAATRGEVDDPAVRQELRALLSQVRAAEHGALATISGAVAAGEGVQSGLQKWSAARGRVLDAWCRSSRQQAVA